MISSRFILKKYNVQSKKLSSYPKEFHVKKRLYKDNGFDPHFCKTKTFLLHQFCNNWMSPSLKKHLAN